MKTFYVKFAIICLSLFAHQASARLFDMKGHESTEFNYSVVKKLFEKSIEPADLSDFDYFNIINPVPRTARCHFYTAAVPEASTAIYISQVDGNDRSEDFFKADARSGNLKKNGDRLLFYSKGGQSLLKILDYFVTYKNPDELITEMNEVPKELMTDGRAGRMRFRRDKSIVVFEYVVIKDSELVPVGYGYCHSFNGDSNELARAMEEENKAYQVGL